MPTNMEELREQITKKNLILNSLNPDDEKNSEKKHLIGKELDKLLYLYFKSLKCAYINIIS